MCREGKINQEDLALIHVTDDVDEAVEFIRASDNTPDGGRS